MHYFKKISEQIYNNLKLDMTLARRVTEQEALEWYFNPYYSFLGSSSDVFTSLF